MRNPRAADLRRSAPISAPFPKRAAGDLDHSHQGKSLVGVFLAGLVFALSMIYYFETSLEGSRRSFT